MRSKQASFVDALKCRNNNKKKYIQHNNIRQQLAVKKAEEKCFQQVCKLRIKL